MFIDTTGIDTNGIDLNEIFLHQSRSESSNNSGTMFDAIADAMNIGSLAPSNVVLDPNPIEESTNHDQVVDTPEPEQKPETRDFVKMILHDSTVPENTVERQTLPGVGIGMIPIQYEIGKFDAFPKRFMYHGIVYTPSAFDHQTIEKDITYTIVYPADAVTLIGYKLINADDTELLFAGIKVDENGDCVIDKVTVALSDIFAGKVSIKF